MNCETRQAHFEQLTFEGGLAALRDEEREHLEACGDCSAHLALVQRLIGDAQDAQPAALPLWLRASVHERSIRALRAHRPKRIFRWDTAAPLAVALLALPLAVGQLWLWAQGLAFLLEPWLPNSVLSGLTIFYAASAALTLGGLYGSLPFAVAYANRNRLEAS